MKTIAIIFSILASIIILLWLYKIDKCICASKIAEKKYLKEWFIFLIIWNVLLLFINDYFNIIILIINLFILMRLFIYIRKIEKNNCNCESSLKNTIIIYIIFSLITFIFAYIIFL